MRIGFISVLTGFALATAISGPRAQTSAALSCYGAQKPKQVAELLFGRDIGRRLGVSDSAWARFVAREMTPRFPDGLTVTDAVGQWRDPATGKIVHEASKHVEIILPGKNDDEAHIDAVVRAYESIFRQQSVGVIIRQACVSF